MNPSTPFTPGPWRQTGPNVRAGDALICYATNHHANAETPEPEKLANARLISAAPQMLMALELGVALVSNIEENDILTEHEREFLEYAREVVAKAKGN